LSSTRSKIGADQPIVWLLREAEEADPYEETFIEAGFAPLSIPVLRYEWVNERALRVALEHPARYSGLICTSPRAVEAIAQVVPWASQEELGWHNRPVFAVGPRTAAGLRSIGFKPEGEESGSAVPLAEHILARTVERRLLFLCGDRRRDELPDRLREGGIELEEICVYRTLLRGDLDFSGLARPEWIVFFSPSGVEAVLAANPPVLSRAKLVAIGETTAEALRAAGLQVHAIAKRPSADGVLLAVRDAVTG